MLPSELPAEPEYLDWPASAEGALAALTEPVARWFRHRFGMPTPVQRLAWPCLAAGGHLLLSAPTGAGKTLAAFLPILDRLLSGPAPPTAAVRCLYVTPLKALGNDIAGNLETTLEGLAAFLPAGQLLPRLLVRTGDTLAGERRRLLREPPEVLLTTPESLALLLSQPAAETLFAGLAWVVVDEVHALAGNKRGADLALSLERLTALAHAGLQRVGLSATATPLVEAARYLAGTGRSCAIARVGEGSVPELRVAPLEGGGSFHAALVNRLVPEVQAWRSTLVFTNTRSLAERLSWGLRRALPDWDACIAVHHSSLSARRRHEVEEGFRRGQLRVVVSSTSLELGIDVGSVDLAVLVHPPGDVVHLLQRVGRSGHGPAGIKRGLVLTDTAGQLLEAAVTAASGRSGQCEPLQVPAHPLDVLCQQLAGMAASTSWCADEAFALVQRAFPYRDLARRDFDDCLAYLRGLGRDGQPWLPPRLDGDGVSFRILDGRTARLLRRNLGTILAEEAVAVVLKEGRPLTPNPSPQRGEGSKQGPSPQRGRGEEASPLTPNPSPQRGRGEEEAPSPPTPLPRSGGEGRKKGPSPQRGEGGGGEEVGQVDEAFAERLQPGDRFLLDGRCLECRGREGGVVLVTEVVGRPVVPRWSGEGLPLSPALARRLYLLRVQASEALRDGTRALAELLQRDYRLDGFAVNILVDYFQRQECVSEIPDAGTCLVEVIAAPAGTDCHIHTPLNRLGNDALARVAVHRLARDHRRRADSIVADLGFTLRVGGFLDTIPEVLRTLLGAAEFDADLDEALAASTTLRERFQRVAVTGLMLLRNPLGGRRRVGGPDWGGRRLFDRVRAHDPDFVLLRQAGREVRERLCDGPQARAFVEELPRLTLRCRALASPSPFAAGWTQAAAGPSEVIETPAEALQRLHQVLMGGALE